MRRGRYVYLGDGGLDPWLVRDWWFLPADEIDDEGLAAVVDRLARYSLTWVLWLIR